MRRSRRTGKSCREEEEKEDEEEQQREEKKDEEEQCEEEDEEELWCKEGGKRRSCSEERMMRSGSSKEEEVRADDERVSTTLTRKEVFFGVYHGRQRFPHLVMYPKQKPLSGRRVTVADDPVFFQKSIASGMLGSVDASEIQADVDAQRTVGTIVENRAE